ncbi:MAG TPA: GNAT family N-acetyltransferase [Vineibacter sp.]|nr:GNAT family N-acetyltransferase [Vineibacter sp.]
MAAGAASSAEASPTDISTLEHLAYNAWPALQVAIRDDWILRFADGYSKRANSVNALTAARDTPPIVLERRIAEARALFARRAIRCVFRISPLMDPQVPAMLQAEGWAPFEETMIMVADLAGADVIPDRVLVAATRAADWSQGYRTFNGVPPERQVLHDRLLDAILPDAGFAMARDAGGRPAAYGLGVVERGHVGLFDIVSDPGLRRAGHGRRVVDGLMAWGRARGATRAYLQVVTVNQPAIALYRSLGFREAYRVHYRAAAV